MSEKPRVVILGGGVGAMTAAFELSRGDWRSRFESITVYQLGWRLGGKGASGRGVHGRIEEHGLHVWFGFYDNAFRMMRECYGELDRPPGSPLATVDDAFVKASCVIAEENLPRGWDHWIVQFPEDSQRPGEIGPRPKPPTVADYLKIALRLAAELVVSAAGPARAEVPTTPESGRPVMSSVSAAIPGEGGLRIRQLATPSSPAGALEREIERDLAAALGELEELTLSAIAPALARVSSLDAGAARSIDQLDDLLELVERWTGVARRVMGRLAQRSDETRRLWQVADVLLACARGILRHGLLWNPDGFDAIDHVDFAEWLMLNGAEEASARSALMKASVYDLTFAYREGDPTKPAFAAGTALRGLFRMFFTYKGAIAWKMTAGMGDVVFGPLHDVLARRGVRFEFFHRVRQLRVSDDGRRIESIEIGRQAELADPSAGYDPLVPVKGLRCWPAQPRYELLRDPDRLRGHNLESFWDDLPDVASQTLVAGEDFDVAVLGIALGAFPFVCPDLIQRHSGWQRMVEHVRTVQTQAFQVWLSAPLDELGCHWPPATTSGYVEPFDSYADMGQTIDAEDWTGRPPVRGVAYFCNVIPTVHGSNDPNDGGVPQRASDAAKANAVRFLTREMDHLWPDAVTRYPQDFRWDLLVGAGGNSSGQRRFDSQYWRANVDPSDRYVQSVPGSSRHRLRPGESGFENLYLAGDWTWCKLNSGCVEAAAISGMLAAHAIQGSPALDQIVGLTGP